MAQKSAVIKRKIFQFVSLGACLWLTVIGSKLKILSIQEYLNGGIANTNSFRLWLSTAFWILTGLLEWTADGSADTCCRIDSISYNAWKTEERKNFEIDRRLYGINRAERLSEKREESYGRAWGKFDKELMRISFLSAFIAPYYCLKLFIHSFDFLNLKKIFKKTKTD